MSTREEIIDYEEHKEEIEKWINLKGELKYRRFLNLLKEKAVPVTWEVLKDTYRYDKRLLFNSFKYLSFFEEFLRAQLWNIGNATYETLENNYFFNIMGTVLKNKHKIDYSDFSFEFLEQNKEKINYLRRRVAHNKIILEGDSKFSVDELLTAMYVTLPKSYQEGFKSAITECSFNLSVPENIVVNLT
ncbi:MAG: hypothetical protein K2L12_00440 [Clostridia bacterium]|nr:hypothetical protein [Clostridia bacterium]